MRGLSGKAAVGLSGVVLAVGLGLTACTIDEPASGVAGPKLASYEHGDKKSGYLFANPETRDIQDDDIANPAFLWVDKAESLWKTPQGQLNTSCANCHGDVFKMRGVGVTYPKYSEKLKKLVNLEQRINLCRVDNMKAPAWRYESEELLGMTTLVKLQSRGMPVNVSIDGPAASFYQKGKAFYEQRRGMFDLACINCHEDNAGKKLGVELLSQGQSNGFPAYRLKWQSLGSLHRRFRGCNEEVRAEQLPNGSDDYVNLELYVASRGQGLASEAPAVRR